MGIDVAGLGNALVDALVPLGDEALLGNLGLTRGRMHPVDHERWESVYAQVDTSAGPVQTPSPPWAFWARGRCSVDRWGTMNTGVFTPRGSPTLAGDMPWPWRRDSTRASACR